MDISTPLRIALQQEGDLATLTQALLEKLPKNITLAGKELIWKRTGPITENTTARYHCNGRAITGPEEESMPARIEVQLAGYQQDKHGQSLQEKATAWQEGGYQMTSGMISTRGLSEQGTIILDYRGAVFISVRRTPKIITEWFDAAQKIYEQQN